MLSHDEIDRLGNRIPTVVMIALAKLLEEAWGKGYDEGYADGQQEGERDVS